MNLPNLRLFTGNRLEALVGALAETISLPSGSPLEEEVIVVQSRGMEHWISMELADRLGICANVRFPFPNAFIREIFKAVIPHLKDDPFYDPEVITWAIMDKLPGLAGKPGFEEIQIYFNNQIDFKNQVYLNNGADDLKCFQLAKRISDTFDQYLVFRPDMITEWDNGKGNHWQARLWRELIIGHEGKHRAAVGQAFFKELENSSGSLKGIPPRVSVFGISALPGFYMELFKAISFFTEVNIFLMNPCREYWGDIVSEKKIARFIRTGHTGKEESEQVTPESLYLEKGNSLLASMGTLGREFFDLVNDTGCEEYALFEDPGNVNLLLSIQSNILNLNEAQYKEGDKTGIVSDDDFSIEFHSCHSIMREIEILQDRLLDMFEKDPALKPGDIIVMTPDITEYAPYIQAVFNIPRSDDRHIPFNIADKSVKQESAVMEPFMKILDLATSRFEASDVIRILEHEVVRQSFEISENDLELIRTWVQGSGIRWGFDEESRRKAGLPSFRENTWKAGIERLLAGYAMMGEGDKMFGDCLPYDQIEGETAEILGRFTEFIVRLFKGISTLDKGHTLNEWSSVLGSMLEDFFMPEGAEERGLQFLRQKFKELEDVQDIHGCDFRHKFDAGVIRSFLSNLMKREGFGFGFMTGGVTFCAMLPMRSIPFKIICLIGMDGNAYPRDSKPPGFDLMAKKPRPGDQSRRNDDQYLFLEALLSARDKLYISYKGQSIQDNSSMPPSVLVNELIEYIGKGYRTGQGDVVDNIFFKHRLQAFSPEYFRDKERLFSYSEENCMAAKALLQGPEKQFPFIPEDLAEPGDEWRDIHLDDLCRFFSNPSAYLLNKRLGVHYNSRHLFIDDKEAFELKGLERYLLEDELVKKSHKGSDLMALLPAIKASGRIPIGNVGQCLYEKTLGNVEGFMNILEGYSGQDVLESITIDKDISGFKVSGTVGNIRQDGMLEYRYARARARDYIFIWIKHLFLSLAAPEGYPKESFFIGIDPASGKERKISVWRFDKSENPEELITTILSCFWKGMRKPLHFFPESSMEYADQLLDKGRSEEDALIRAKKIWKGNQMVPGECEDPYFEKCFKNSPAFDDDFTETAKEILGPLIGHRHRIEDGR